MYIYDLPIQARKEVCKILDQNDKWDELGGLMQFDQMTLSHMRREILRGKSPTDELLTIWGHRNHTVVELFFLLSRMHHYQAMVPLREYVDSKYHKLMYDEASYITQVRERMVHPTAERNKNEPCVKNLNIPQENFHDPKTPNNEVQFVVNQIQPLVPAMQKLVIPKKSPGNAENIVSNENNESVIPHTVNNQGDTNRSRKLSVRSPDNLNTQIPYNELTEATNNWAANTILGKGGFGTVFKGIWKCTEVAIKRVEQRNDSKQGHIIQLEQSFTELNCLNSYRHDNVLPLYGYSLSGAYPCLVYQFMPGGCLEQRLRTQDQRKQLNWAKRLHIAKGTARGLQFLHTFTGTPLIHGDIKSANILLDLNDDPKIGDFGLAREGPKSNYTHIEVSRIHGTRPYLPEEFLRSKHVSTKVDTYSFGVVLFEIATGLSAYNDNRKEKFLKEHVVNYEGDINALIDIRAGMENVRYCTAFIELGKVCVKRKPSERPEMVTVYKTLDELQ